MANTEYKRIIAKSGNGVPTIPSSPSHDLGDWIETDIYEGEYYTDLDTRKTYTRVGDSIVFIGMAGKTATAINFADCTVTNPPTENDGDVYILVDGSGSPMDVDTIQFQGGSLHTVRYSFNDFAMMTMGVGVAIGDYFRVSGALNPKHDGTFIITDFDDTAGWIEIYNPLISNAGDNEASDSSATAYFTKAAWDGGKPNDVAKFEASTGLWYIVTPEQGDTVILLNDDYEYEFNGTYWESKLKNHIVQTGNVHNVQGSQITFADTTVSNPLSALDIDAALKELSARGNLYERLTNKNAANGYAGLDASTKIPIGLLPDSVLGALKFKGTWDASGDVINSADLSIDGDPLAPITADATNEGWYFIVFNTGTTSVGGITDWKVGDWVLSTGAYWTKIENTDAVVSVNGQIGAVVLDTDDISEGGTNLYHTSARVLATLLTGLSASAGTFTATDNILFALGKIKYRIDNFSTYVRDTLLTGLASTSGNLSATESILDSFSKVNYFMLNIATTVRATVLTGVDITLAGAVSATDTVLEAFGRLQKQITNLTTSVTTNTTDIATINGRLIYSIVPSGDFNLSTATGVQSAFPATGDVITLDANTTYEFEWLIFITKSGTTCTTSAGFALGGGASVTDCRFISIGGSGVGGAAGVIFGAGAVGGTQICVTSTTNVLATIKGLIRMNAGGTVTPQINFSASPTSPVMIRSSYIKFTKWDSDTTNTKGSVA